MEFLHSGKNNSLIIRYLSAVYQLIKLYFYHIVRSKEQLRRQTISQMKLTFLLQRKVIIKKLKM